MLFVKKIGFLKGTNLLNLSLVFVLVVIIGAGLVSYRTNDEVYSVELLRKNIFKNVELLQELILTQLDADEARSQFLKVTDSSKRDEYFKKAKRLEQIVFELKESGSKYGLSNSGIDELEILIRERTNLQNLALLSNDYVWFETDHIKIHEYQRRIHRLTNTLQNEQFKYLVEWDARVIANNRNTSFSILVGTVLTSTIFLFIFFLLRKEIEERKKVEKIIRHEMHFKERLLNSTVDGILAFDDKCNFTVWNPGMEILTGISAADVIGKNVFETFPTLKEIGEDKFFYETLNGHFIASTDRQIKFDNSDSEFYYEANYSPILDSDKNVIGGLAILRNTTQRKLASEALQKAKNELEERVTERTAELVKLNEELKQENLQRKIAEKQISQSLQEKVILLQEIHHRVKNNLQVISSLLNLQSNYVDDEKALEVFRESRNRVKTMALIHERLYQSKDLNKIDFGNYLQSLCHDLFSSYNISESKIKLKIDAGGIFFEIDTAIICGLIVNELVSNSLKHAFPGSKKGEINVILNEENKIYFLKVIDNGVGFPSEINFTECNTLGLRLVSTLTEQLGGNISLNREGLTEFVISFKTDTAER